MELWQSLLVVFGGNAVLLVMLAFFSRALMETLLAKNVEQFKSDLASASEIAIERLRADLRLAAIEHEVRFSRLHEKRAEVLAELYKLLVAAVLETQKYAANADSGDRAEKREKYLRTVAVIREYFSYFDQHRIYLPQPLCDLLEQFDRDLRAPTHSVWAFARVEDFTLETIEKMEPRLTKAWEAIEQDVPRVRAAIENEFRKLLGV